MDAHRSQLYLLSEVTLCLSTQAQEKTNAVGGRQARFRKHPYLTSTWGDFPGGPAVKICASNAGGVGSILGQGTMIPQVVQQEEK